MIVDCHVHVFPPQAEACGFEDAATHLRYIQRSAYSLAQRRRRDHTTVQRVTLWDGARPGLSGMRRVDFQVGRYGRLEWTADGEDYYGQWLPPGLQDLSAPAEFMLAHMEYAGVNRAVLQNAYPYGLLNDYFAECVRRYPDRFWALVQVNEARADQETEVRRLSRGIEDLGLHGLYYAVVPFFMRDFQDQLDDRKFDPFWETVRDLGIPVFWDVGAGIPQPSAANYLEQLRRLGIWAQRYPGVPCVLVHGVRFGLFLAELKFDLPEEVLALLRRDQFMTEVLFPITYGARLEYPYAETQDLLKGLYLALGAEKLVWGSDMPCVEKYCTYAQSLNYLRRHCRFIPEGDMDLILGGNMARLFNRRPVAPCHSQPGLQSTEPGPRRNP